MEETFANMGGLANDRANKGNANNKRQVTLIQHEHIKAIASFLGKETIDPWTRWDKLSGYSRRENQD